MKHWFLRTASLIVQSIMLLLSRVQGIIGINILADRFCLLPEEEVIIRKKAGLYR